MTAVSESPMRVDWDRGKELETDILAVIKMEQVNNRIISVWAVSGRMLPAGS